MKRVFSLLLTIIISLSVVGNPALSQNKLTPDEILAKAISAIADTKGTEAKFTVYNSGYSGGGIIRTSGQKFNVTMPDIGVWYNGKELYTYNSRTEETTLINPTPEELSESNPLAYVSGAQKNYNVAFSTVKKQGKYVLELTPKAKRGEIKRITLTLRSNDYTPEKIVVEPSSGNPVSAEISSFKTGVSFPANEFEYPKNKYPKAEIIDLR